MADYEKIESNSTHMQQSPLAVDLDALPQPNPLEVDCSSWIHVHSNNIKDYKIVDAVLGHYCHKVTCLFPPCVKSRINKHAAKYEHSFDDSTPVYSDTCKGSLDEVKKAYSKCFKKLLIFNCFDHVEVFAAKPKKLIKDSLEDNFTILHDTKEYHDALRQSIQHYQVNANPTIKIIEGDGEDKQERRVRKQNIVARQDAKKMITIDGYYAIYDCDDMPDGKRKGTWKYPCGVKFRVREAIPEGAVWREDDVLVYEQLPACIPKNATRDAVNKRITWFDDSGAIRTIDGWFEGGKFCQRDKWIEVNYPEAVKNHKIELELFYGFDAKRFEKYCDCENCIKYQPLGNIAAEKFRKCLK